MELKEFVPTKASSENNNPRSKLVEQDAKHSQSNGAYEILKSAWDLARLFGKRTTIHGVNRLLGETERRYERTIWFLTIMMALSGSVYVCLLLSNRFNEGKLQTVIDSTKTPVYTVYFPVITICNLNRLNWARINEAKHRFLPNETSTEMLETFERIVGTYDDIGFANFGPFSNLEGLPLDYFNHINFSEVVDFMTWRCGEILRECEWRHSRINCCQIFSKRRTKQGPCWAFNTLQTEEGRRMQQLDPMWPWRTGGVGPKSALKLRVLIHPDKHYPNRKNAKGLNIMISEPYVWHIDHFRIYENTETMVAVEPIKYYHDNDTRSISSKQRQCVFKDERSSSDFKSLHNYIYMYENCQAECHQEYLMRYCNCTVDLLFPPGQYPSCKIKDLICLARYNDHFLFSYQPDEKDFVRNADEGMSCRCLRNCDSLHYSPDARSSFLSSEIRRNTSYVDLDIHYRYDTLMVYRTSLVFGWVDLMVAFGGIAGLFLGCSLISAMELIYFACIEIPSFILERVINKKNPLRNLTTPNDCRSSHLRFSGFIERNKSSDITQFEDFVLNRSKIFTEMAPNYSFQPKYIKIWNRMRENLQN